MKIPAAMRHPDLTAAILAKGTKSSFACGAMALYDKYGYAIYYNSLVDEGKGYEEAMKYILTSRASYKGL